MSAPPGIPVGSRFSGVLRAPYRASPDLPASSGVARQRDTRTAAGTHEFTVAKKSPSAGVDPVPEGGSWRREFLADLARYRATRPGVSDAVLLVTEQGLWALLQFRVASSLHRAVLPRPLKRGLLIACGIWQKCIEMTTGVSIPYKARIGPGLYIGHFGNVIIHEDVVIGHTCNLSQGVTIGSSGRGAAQGVPVLGSRVYVAANAVVVGRIHVGDTAAIAANSLVTRNVPAATTVMGVPARPVSRLGSAGYIRPLVAAPPATAPELRSAS